LLALVITRRLYLGICRNLFQGIDIALLNQYFV
jgi:hypothetical protein